MAGADLSEDCAAVLPERPFRSVKIAFFKFLIVFGGFLVKKAAGGRTGSQGTLVKCGICIKKERVG